jgi:hypothetical protein
MKRFNRHQAQAAQRGMAALVVVTVLFIITSLVAAYTSRNLIFEQRTSANQYRSTQAFETAEAGIEWSLAMLNHSRIAANCETSANPSDNSFRQRYLNIDAATGNITARLRSTGQALLPSCVFNGGNWSCDCPADAAPVLDAPAGAGVFPAFRIRFSAVTGQPGMVRIESNGCTRLDDACLNFPSQGAGSEGRATVTVLAALVSGLASPPAAPLTVRGNVNAAGTLSLSAYNTDVPTGGVTLQAKGSVNTAGFSLFSVPSVPGELSVIDNDHSLPGTADRMFSSVFNIWPDTYRQQPAAVTLDCGPTGCSASTVRDAVALNPGRVIWLQGDLALDSAGDIGSADEPVLLVVNGSLIATGSLSHVYGLVYVRTSDWVSSGSAQVHGAIIADGNLAGAGSPVLVYDAAILKKLRLATGSFVRVPGSWKDF